MMDKMREEFEAWVRDSFRCGENSLGRDHDGRYYSVVSDKYLHATYSDVSMLWAAWQAARQSAGQERVEAVGYTYPHEISYAKNTTTKGSGAFWCKAEPEDPAAAVYLYTAPAGRDERIAERAIGRAEAFDLLASLHPADISDFVESFQSGPEGEWDEGWKRDKLREFLKVDDAAWSLLDKSEAHGWHLMGQLDETRYLLTESREREGRMREAVSQYARVQDGVGGCSDGACVVQRPTGMHTNGGCKCWKDSLTAQRMMRAGDQLARTIAALAAEKE